MVSYSVYILFSGFAANALPVPPRGAQKNVFDRGAAEQDAKEEIKKLAGFKDTEAREMAQINMIIDFKKQIYDEKQANCLLNREVGKLENEKEGLLEIKWANIARGYIEIFVEENYHPDEKDEEINKAELAVKLKSVKKEDLRDAKTEFWPAIQIKWILKKGKGYEVEELRKKLTAHSIQQKKFSKLMGKAYLLLCKRIHALVPSAAKGSPVVFNVTDRDVINEMIKVFLSLFNFGASNPQINRDFV